MSEKRLTRSTTTSAALTPATNLINNELVEKKRNSTKRKLINGEKQLDGGGGGGGFAVKTASLVDDEASSGEAVKQLINATRLNLKQQQQQQSSTNPVRTSSRLSKSNVHNNSYTVLFNNSETSSSSIASSSNMSFDQSTHESLCMPAVTVDVPRKAAAEFDADESTTTTNVRAKKLAVKTALTENASHNHNHVNSANDSVVQGRAETSTSTTNTDTMPIRNRSSFRLGSINNNNTNNNNNSHPVESEKISTRRRSSNYLKTNGTLTSSLSSVAGNFLDQSFPSRKRTLNNNPNELVGSTSAKHAKNEHKTENPTNENDKSTHWILTTDPTLSIASSSASSIDSSTAMTNGTETNNKNNNNNNISSTNTRRINSKHKNAFKELSMNDNNQNSSSNVNGISRTSRTSSKVKNAHNSHNSEIAVSRSRSRDRGSKNASKLSLTQQYAAGNSSEELTTNQPLKEETCSHDEQLEEDPTTGHDHDHDHDHDDSHVTNCPVLNCNSIGSLDGSSEHHFSFDKCPVYFGMSSEECMKRKLQLDKHLLELDEKLNRINENKKSLRNKKISQEQTDYYAQVSQELKNIVKSESTKSRCAAPIALPDSADFLGDIKNLTTSFIISSISNSLTPTPMPNNFIKSNNASNFLNNFNKSIAKSPCIDDLDVSNYELNIFKDVLVASTRELIPQYTQPDRNKRITLVRQTNKLIQFGNYEIETWYKSPYPDDYWQLDKIFICQYCLIYMKSHSVLNRHLEKCLWRHPPGREIYRKDVYSFFEVDGKFNKLYCQNLCLLAKLFLDHKTLYFDVEPFLFYVLTKYDEATGSFQMIGYFSKEKQSLMNYNLSCILILPQYMNQSYGRLLIDFSYLLSRVEGKIGSPERPLSDLGLISYRSYWKSKVLAYLGRHMDESEISAKEISMETGILSNDIISTLQYIGLIKYWKGKHVILKDQELIDKYLQRKYSPQMDVEASCLKWTPYVYQTIINEAEPATPFRNKQTNLFSSSKNNISISE